MEHLPGIGIMLTLTYAYLGATPTMRAELSGLGPVVLGMFMVAVYRLGRAAATTTPQFLMAIMAAAAFVHSPGHCGHSGPRGGGELCAVVHPHARDFADGRTRTNPGVDHRRDARGWAGGITLILGGAGVGILRSRLCALPGVRATLRHIVAILDTYSFQAPGFYQRLGYEVFGVIHGYPRGYQKWFLKKRLA
jgi:hypothetical protein